MKGWGGNKGSDQKMEKKLTKRKTWGVMVRAGAVGHWVSKKPAGGCREKLGWKPAPSIRKYLFRGENLSIDLVDRGNGGAVEKKPLKEEETLI